MVSINIIHFTLLYPIFLKLNFKEEISSKYRPPLWAGSPFHRKFEENLLKKASIVLVIEISVQSRFEND